MTLWPVDATPLDERRVNFPRLSRARAYYKINIKLTRAKEKYVLARLTCDVACPRSLIPSPKMKPDRLPEGDWQVGEGAAGTRMAQERLLRTEAHLPRSLPESHLQLEVLKLREKEGMSEGIGAFNTVRCS